MVPGGPERTIKSGGAVWTVEDGDAVPGPNAHRYRGIVFRSGGHVRVGRIASGKQLSELSDETLELMWILSTETAR